jgi:hypothetical protein
MQTRRRVLIAVLLTVGACLTAPIGANRAVAAAVDLPARLSDQDYWALIGQISEPNGYFQSDNLVGNERPLQFVVPALKTFTRGGAYLGVAPDQNFTYIVALEPKIAFICDIRRGNLHEHLMYKALFELSADRADFVSRLFSKKRPDGLTAKSTVGDIMNAFWNVTTDDALYAANLKSIDDLLVTKHGFTLSAEDLQGIEYVYHAFYWFGPSITYSSSSPNGRGSGNMPSYGDLVMLTDLEGQSRGYLASEENYHWLKSFEEKNLLIPVVGDFAGPKALRSVGKYLAEHGATVSAFYVSNVEQYLFQNQVWGGFYENVSTLPLDAASTFIRSARQQNVLDPIQALIKDYREGRIRSYTDITIRGAIR